MKKNTLKVKANLLSLKEAFWGTACVTSSLVTSKKHSKMRFSCQYRERTTLTLRVREKTLALQLDWAGKNGYQEKRKRRESETLREMHWNRAINCVSAKVSSQKHTLAKLGWSAYANSYSSCGKRNFFCFGLSGDEAALMIRGCLYLPHRFVQSLLFLFHLLSWLGFSQS